MGVVATITKDEKNNAQELARRVQKRLINKVKVKVGPKTYIYIPKEIASSPKNLTAFLEKREQGLLILQK